MPTRRRRSIASCSSSDFCAASSWRAYQLSLRSVSCLLGTEVGERRVDVEIAEFVSSSCPWRSLTRAVAMCNCRRLKMQLAMQILCALALCRSIALLERHQVLALLAAHVLRRRTPFVTGSARSSTIAKRRRITFEDTVRRRPTRPRRR